MTWLAYFFFPALDAGRTFSRSRRGLHVFASSFDWFSAFLALFVIGHFGFDNEGPKQNRGPERGRLRKHNRTISNNLQAHFLFSFLAATKFAEADIAKSLLHLICNDIGQVCWIVFKYKYNLTVSCYIGLLASRASLGLIERKLG